MSGDYYVTREYGSVWSDVTSCGLDAKVNLFPVGNNSSTTWGLKRPKDNVQHTPLPEPNLEELAAKMWDQMYIHAQKVIVPCPHCQSHNAVTNPTCIRCGGPMGAT